jgi:hypothetical protein
MLMGSMGDVRRAKKVKETRYKREEEGEKFKEDYNYIALPTAFETDLHRTRTWY